MPLCTFINENKLNEQMVYGNNQNDGYALIGYGRKWLVLTWTANVSFQMYSVQ